MSILKKFPFRPDDFLYLLMMSILSYMGMYFVGNILSVGPNATIFLKALTHILLLLNSLILYLICFKSSDERFIALLISSLYLISPIHFDAFFFSFQIQALLAESCLLIFYYCYISDKQWGIFGAILCAVILNTKLSFALPLVCTSSKLSRQQKFMLGAAFGIVWIYLIPQFFEQVKLSYISSIYSQLQLIIAPVNFSLFDSAILIPHFYSFISLLLIVLMILFLLAYTKFYKKDLFPLFLFSTSIALVGAYTPFIRFNYTYDGKFLLMPTLYPTILLGILLCLLAILPKFRWPKLYLVAGIAVAGFWLLTGMNIQTMAKNPDNFWQYSLQRLPNEYFLKEEIKFKYANFLIDNSKLDRAEVLIKEAKDIYPKIEWYHLLLKVLALKGDNAQIEKIQSELITRKIPYMNSEEN